MPTFLSSLLSNTGATAASPLSAALANWGMDMGGGQGAGQFPSAPPAGGYQMPQASSLNLLSPEIAMPIAAALMGGRGNADALAGGMAALGEGMGKIRSRNQLNGLMKDYPELAPFLDAGADPADVLKVVMHKKGYNDGTLSYSSPTVMRGKDGQDHYVMFGNDGTMKVMDDNGNGLTPKGKITYRDQGTYTGVFQDGEEIGSIPKDIYGAGYARASGAAAGKVEGEAKGVLPQAVTRAQQTVKDIDELVANPGLDELFGRFNQFRPSVLMSDKGRDAQARYNQLKGKAFLQAYDQLRGGGAISEVEGAKGEDAIARMDRAQTKEDFVRALTDLREVIAVGVQNAQQMAGTAVDPTVIPQPPSPPAAGDAQRTRVIGGKTYVFQNGKWYEQ